MKDKLAFPVTIKERVDVEEEQHPILAYAAYADSDTVYFNESMREPKRVEFIKAITKVVQSKVALKIMSGSWCQGHQFHQEPKFFQLCRL